MSYFGRSGIIFARYSLRVDEQSSDTSFFIVVDDRWGSPVHDEHQEGEIGETQIPCFLFFFFIKA